MRRIDRITRMTLALMLLWPAAVAAHPVGWPQRGSGLLPGQWMAPDRWTQPDRPPERERISDPMQAPSWLREEDRRRWLHRQLMRSRLSDRG